MAASKTNVAKAAKRGRGRPRGSGEFSERLYLRVSGRTKAAAAAYRDEHGDGALSELLRRAIDRALGLPAGAPSAAEAKGATR